MNLRERIADWISGGKLSDEYWSKQCWISISDNLERDNNRLVKAINEIISQEKPTSNSTVKRMARIAKEALNGQ